MTYRVTVERHEVKMFSLLLVVLLERSCVHGERRKGGFFTSPVAAEEAPKVTHLLSALEFGVVVDLATVFVDKVSAAQWRDERGAK